jgi:integrase
MVKRSFRAGVEDRWHRALKLGEKVAQSAKSSRSGTWCTDGNHGNQGTLVASARHGRGKRWLARWVDQEGNERSKAFDRKTEAQQHITDVTTAITTGSYADPRRAAATFATVAEEWFGSKSSLKPKTVAGYRSLLDVVVLPKWGNHRLRDIDHAAVQAWVSWLANDPAARQRPVKRVEGDCNRGMGLSPARVIQAFQVLDQVLRYAVRSRYIAANPAGDVQQPRKNTAEKMALTHAQVHELASAAGELATMVYVLAYGGLRYGECAALRIRDIDFEKRRIRVSRSVTYVSGKGQLEGPTKSHQTRVVPLPQMVVDRLCDELSGRAAGDRVFSREGDIMALDWFRVRFDKASASAGLSGITPHTLRHTAGSLAIASGASVVTVQKLLGHRSPVTTMTIYSHMLPDDFDNLADAMDAAARAATS